MAKNKRKYSVMLRYAVVLLVMIIFSVAIAHKLYINTIRDAKALNDRVERDFSERGVLAPVRGDILADDGTVLATNMQFYRISIDFSGDAFADDSLRKYLEPLVDSLTIHFPHKTRAQWREDFTSQLDKPKAERKSNYTLMRRASYADYVRLRSFPFLNAKNRYRCGIRKDEYTRRVYPYGKMARRSIGIVTQDSVSQEWHGLWGLERSLDKSLYGIPGVTKKIPLTRRVEEWTEHPAVNGYHITTTIDVNIQEMVDEELSRGLEFCAADWGVAILMDVRTGDIKAIANLERNSAGQYIESLNHAVMRYEPGSVVKVLSMAIALEDGIVNENSSIETGAVWKYCGYDITDTHVSATKTPREIISGSSNIGMAKIITSHYGKKPSAWHERLASIGLFEPMNSGIAGETNPLVAQLKDDKGGRLTLSRQAYGYATEFSPLWTLSIYNAIANGGRFVRPRLVTKYTRDGVDSVVPVSYIRDRLCSADHARMMREWIADVVDDPHGTAHSLRSDLVHLAGKTGTCYLIDPETRQYIKGSKRLTFCGFYPAENPVYSCIVVVNHPTENAFGAASTSGNIFRSIAHKLYARGLLNNASDYCLNANEGTVPTLYSSLLGGRNADLRRLFNIKGTPTALPKPRQVQAGVPDVTGLSVREAVLRLESAGLNVTATGVGRVTAQAPAAGASYRRGQKVALTLKP